MAYRSKYLLRCKCSREEDQVVLFRCDELVDPKVADSETALKDWVIEFIKPRCSICGGEVTRDELVGLAL